MSCFVCLPKSLQTGLTTPFFPWFSEPDMSTLKCDRKKKKNGRDRAAECRPFPGQIGPQLPPRLLKDQPESAKARSEPLLLSPGKRDSSVTFAHGN